MKKICLLVALFLFATIPAEAVAPVNANTITAALAYGKNKAGVPLNVFFQPWTVYEERSDKLDETAERACFFTPFLLIAADARDRAVSGAPVTQTDVERILSDYNGYVIFAVTLYGRDAKFAGKLTASLRQEKATIRARLVNSPPLAEIVSSTRGGDGIYEAQCFVYFLTKEVAADKPATLLIATGDRRQRSFYFQLSNYK